MYSMTGYGKAEKTIDGRELCVEIKSVNHRFLDINSKLPKSLICVEDVMRKTIQQGLSRGRIDVFVTYQDKRTLEKNVSVDIGLAKGYYNALSTIKKELNLDDDTTLTTFLRIPDVIKPESVDDDLEVLSKLMEETVKEAIDKMNVMRKREGEKLKKDIENRIGTLKELLKKVEERAPIIVEKYSEKLESRISEHLKGVELDQSKLINEVAFFTDKANIDEEITRLKSHFVQGEKILAEEILAGRKLDFLIQEFNRETNTICSKSNDLELTNTALSMKSEIEKIREQVQNLE